MHGALLIDKPAGLTSHDVVARVRKIIRERRVGHTGTLDPFATGLLLVLVGKATRLAQFLNPAEKEYEGIIRVGYATETGDLTGKQITKTRAVTEFHRAQMDSAFASLRGEIEQIPPMYSAKKLAGRKLYELARRGHHVERVASRVQIHSFEPCHDSDLRKNDDGTTDLSVRVVCSAGTYIRVLAEDFGKHLGLGSHLAGLRRVRVGPFTINDAITLDCLEGFGQDNSIERALISPRTLLAHLPDIQLRSDDVQRTLRGIDLQVNRVDWKTGQPVRLSAGDDLIAVGKYDESRRIVHPAVVVASS